MRTTNILAEINLTSPAAITFYVFIGIIVGFILVVLIATLVMRKVMDSRRKAEASNSLPEGGDTSEFAKILQDKYREERDRGEIKRPTFK